MPVKMCVRCAFYMNHSDQKKRKFMNEKKKNELIKLINLILNINQARKKNEEIQNHKLQINSIKIKNKYFFRCAYVQLYAILDVRLANFVELVAWKCVFMCVRELQRQFCAFHLNRRLSVTCLDGDTRRNVSTLKCYCFLFFLIL